MARPTPGYRSLLVLYPREFRREYGEDLVQFHRQLVADRGRAAAVARTALDLLVTVPRYRLETVMTEDRSSLVLYLGIALLAGGGVVSVMLGAVPGLILVVAAIALTVSQRADLAQAIRRPDRDARHRRLVMAGMLGLLFVGLVAVYMWDIRDDTVGDASLLLYNLIGLPAMVGAVVLLISGLLTPRQPSPASS